MNRAIIPLILLIISLTVFTSGCETKTANQTWGQKNINMELIQVANNSTSDRYEYNGTSYYNIDGYVLNKNSMDALEVKMRATFYDAQGNVFAVNDTVYLEPKTIPANGNSYFYCELADPEKKITTYKVEVLSAKAQYWG